MAAMTAISGGLAFNNALNDAKAIKAQGKYQKMLGEQNAAMADMNGRDAIRRGEEDARTVQKAAKRNIGAQRAALAAQGIEIDSGSALDVQMDTANAAAVDVVTVKNNAWREAWGFKIEAINQTAQGQMAYIGAKQKANSTIISGGANFANSLGQAGSQAAAGASKGGA